MKKSWAQGRVQPPASLCDEDIDGRGVACMLLEIRLGLGVPAGVLRDAMLPRQVRPGPRRSEEAAKPWAPGRCGHLWE
jgi:hypothetical protein